VVGFQVMMCLFQQWIIPSVKNSLIPFSVSKKTNNLLLYVSICLTLRLLLVMRQTFASDSINTCCFILNFLETLLCDSLDKKLCRV
jgi:hypothetical protein